MTKTFTFTRGTADDQRRALLTFRSNGSGGDALDERIDAFITTSWTGPRASIDLATAIWDAGADVDPELMTIAAAICEWANRGGFTDFGKPRGEPEALSARIAAALYRDAGLAGEWPDTASDPERGEGAAVAPTLPV